VSAIPHQALYRRWRAQTFGQIVGQEAVVETLRNAVRSDRVAHALLFVGPRGTGKTSMARIVAKALNCTDLRDGEPCDRCEACVSIRDGRALDVVEMDAASNNRVDDMRDLLARTMTAPSDLRRKVYIVDEVQRITQGWDVLLRTLEEPPEGVAFIFCTTDSGQIRPAVLSRVQRFDFRRLTVPQIEGKLRMILEAIDRAADPDAVELIARLASGGMRDAESMLDQLLSSGAERLTAGQVRALLGLADAEAVDRFVTALVTGDALGGIAVLDELEETGTDLRSFLDQVVDALRLELTASLAGSTDAGPVRSMGSGIAAARRLAAIDAAQLGPGGLRFQLELALLTVGTPGAAVAPAASEPATTLAIPGPSATRRVADEKPRAAPSPSAAPKPTPRKQPAIEASRSKARADAPGVPGEAGRGGGVALSDASRAVPTTGRVSRAPSAFDPSEAHAASPALAGASLSPTESAPSAPWSAAGSPDAGAGSPDVHADPAVTPDAAAGSPDVHAGSPDSGASSLEELRRRWPEVVRDISQHPPTKPLIAVCRPIAVEGDTVILGFPEEQSFLKDVAERRRAILEEGVGRHLGRPVIVRCVATNLDLVAPLTEDEAAARLLDEARRIFADDLIDVNEVG
jgi:DNA polymerase-3 subunit gamma/tau